MIAIQQKIQLDLTYNSYEQSHAAFRLACRSRHCRFDDDICTTAQAPLAGKGWPSGKQRLANRSTTLSLCPPQQIADSWILFNSGAMPLGDKAKAALPLRAATLKQQAVITRRSSKAVSCKLVWNQHKTRIEGGRVTSEYPKDGGSVCCCYDWQLTAELQDALCCA